MARLLIANYIEHTDVSTKIMAVQIGKDDTIPIKENVLNEICQTLKKYHFETGGIIGCDEAGVITAFRFDNIQSPKLYEYYPDTNFLNKIINEDWVIKDITFLGFVHSHLNNATISDTDILYSRHILDKNKFLENILIGIFDISKDRTIKWFIVGMDYIFEVAPNDVY